MNVKCVDCIVGESIDNEPVFESDKKDFNEIIEYGHDRGLLRYEKNIVCPICLNRVEKDNK